MRIWSKALEPHDFEAAQRAVLELVGTHPRQPHVADVISRTRELALGGGPQGLLSPHEAADVVLGLASRLGRYRWVEDFPDQPRGLRDVFGSSEWATRVCDTTDRDRSVVAAQIRDTWAAHRKRIVRDGDGNVPALPDAQFPPRVLPGPRRALGPLDRARRRAVARRGVQEA